MTMNKILLIACIFGEVFLSTFAQNDNWSPPLLVNMTKECMIIANAKPEDTIYITKDWEPKTPAQACLVSCFFQKLGVAFKNGTFDVETTMKAYEFFNNPPNPPFYKKEDFPNIKKLLVACNGDEPKIDNECDAMRAYFVCYIKRSKEFNVPLNN